MRILDEYSTRAVQSAEAELGGPDETALDRIRDYLLANARGSACNPRGCLLARGTAELASVDAEVAERAKQAYDGLSAVLARTVEAAQRAGTIDPEADPVALGDLILAVHRGTEALGRGGAQEPTLVALVETFMGSLGS
jgi:AcrR family transcriptional regulator